MSLVFAQRADFPERMDTESLEETDIARVLAALEKINTWLGGVRATLWHLKRFSRFWNPGETIQIMDWGTGGADIPRAIVRWGRKNGFRIEMVGVDNNPVIVDYAREACRDFPEIRIIESDALFRHPPRPPIGTIGRMPIVLPMALASSPKRGAGVAEDLPLAYGMMDSPPTTAGNDEIENSSFDYALSSLTLHHLSNPQIVQLLKRSDRVARRGIIMNDLQRSAHAWAWIWALSRLGQAHPVVRHDGPLSVRRAFTPGELLGYARQAGLPYLKVHTHFGYRLSLAGEKIG